MLQAALIIGGNLKLVPLTGITLPFVSYGGSSLLANGLVVGMLLAFSDTSATRTWRHRPGAASAAAGGARRTLPARRRRRPVGPRDAVEDATASADGRSAGRHGSTRREPA